MAAQVWRLGAIEVTGGSDLELTELRLLGGSGPIDVGAVVTCSHPPVGGELAHLSDGNPSTRCKWRAEDLRQPGFYIQWHLEETSEFWAVEIVVPVVAARPSAFRMSYLGASGWIVQKDFFGLSAPTSGVLTVGESAAGSAKQGYLVAVFAGTAATAVAHTNTESATWAADYGDTLDIGVFAAALSNPGDTGVCPSKTVTDFSIHDEYEVRCANGAWTEDVANLDIEFMSSTGAVVAAVRSIKRGNFSVRMSYGTSLTVLTDATYTGSTPSISGTLSFTAEALIWKSTGGNNTHSDWSLNVPMASVTSVRFSQARASMGSWAVASATVSVKRKAKSIAVGHTGVRAVSTPLLVNPVSPTHETLVPQGLQNTSCAAASCAHDTEFGGYGCIYGTVELYAQSGNIPLPRRVRLHRSRDGLLVRETWSDAQGNYRFDGITDRYKYDVIAWDHEGLQQSVVANDLTPEVMP